MTFFRAEQNNQPETNGRSDSRADTKSAHDLDIVVLGLSISSSWGNGHATTYRSLLREMWRRGHRITFLERNTSWYENNRDLADPPYCELVLYKNVGELRRQHEAIVRDADVVLVGSFVPDGVEVANWAIDAASGIIAFYDIDTPVTLAKIDRGDYEYLDPELITRFDLYLSFTGGRILDRLEQEFGAPSARPLYCSVDPDDYYPDNVEVTHDLGYMGTYSDDRQPPLEKRLIEAARNWPEGRFVVAGPGYPDEILWPPNVDRIDHLPPAEHRRFYNSQRFTLNITRADMMRVGYAPSVRLFEAAACGAPIISDYWEGIETIFEPGREILISNSADDTLRYAQRISEKERRAIGRRARDRVRAAHTAAHRAKELEGHLAEAMKYRNATTAE